MDRYNVVSGADHHCPCGRDTPRPPRVVPQDIGEFCEGCDALIPGGARMCRRCWYGEEEQLRYTDPREYA